MRVRGGFTMMEVMVVAVLISVVALGIGSTFLSGVKMWERIKDKNFTEISLWLTMEQVAKELRQSVQTRLESFHGSEGTLDFPLLNGYKLKKVSYVLDSALKAVVRHEQRLTGLQEGVGEAQEKEQIVLLGVGGAFEYLYKPSENEAPLWSGSFEHGQGILCAVKLQIESGNKIFEKTVFLPQGG